MTPPERGKAAGSATDGDPRTISSTLDADENIEGTPQVYATCGCCHGNGWNVAGTYFECEREHHTLFDFAGLVLVACPHCTIDTPVVPLRASCASVEEASRLLGPLAAVVVARHVDELGFHHGELRQQRALDRIERLMQFGHYRQLGDAGRVAA